MKILYFSPILWNDLKQRPQHLAEELSKNHEVYYIEPSVSYLNCLIRKSDLYKPNYFPIDHNLTVRRFSGKFRFPKSFEVLDILGLNTLYQERQIKQLSQECDIIWLGSPVYYALFRNTKDKVIVYDKMDDYAYLTRNPLLRRLIRKNEKQLIDRASLIFTTCHVFFEQLKEKNNSVFLIKNGVDSFNFKTNISNRKNSITSHIEELKNQGKTVFGYIGTIDHWFDFNAIEQIIRHNDKFDVVLIGKNNMPKLDQSNIYYFDPVKKEELACIVNRFDFCLYPFKKDDFLDTINPVKLYEYLSQNKKVIAVSSNETREFENHIKLYSDYRELNNILSDLENIPNPFADNLQAGIFTSENSWSVKAEKISRQLVDVFNSKLSNEK